MERNLASVLALGVTAAISVTLAALTPESAYADDITVDATPFSGSKTRAQVLAELSSQTAGPKTGAGEWALHHEPLAVVRSTSTRRQAQAGYKASRSYVAALTGEDSGSASLSRSSGAPDANPSATMGGAAR